MMMAVLNVYAIRNPEIGGLERTNIALGCRVIAHDWIAR